MTLQLATVTGATSGSASLLFVDNVKVTVEREAAVPATGAAMLIVPMSLVLGAGTLGVFARSHQTPVALR